MGQDLDKEGSNVETAWERDISSSGKSTSIKEMKRWSAVRSSLTLVEYEILLRHSGTSESPDGRGRGELILRVDWVQLRA